MFVKHTNDSRNDRPTLRNNKIGKHILSNNLLIIEFIFKHKY